MVRQRDWGRIQAMVAWSVVCCIAAFPTVSGCQQCTTYDLRLLINAPDAPSTQVGSPVTVEAMVILAHVLDDGGPLGVDRPLGTWMLWLEGSNGDGFDVAATPYQIAVTPADWADAEPASGPSGQELRLTFPVRVAFTPTSALGGAGLHTAYLKAIGETDANIDGPQTLMVVAETAVVLEGPAPAAAPGVQQEAPGPAIAVPLLVIALAARFRRCLDL